MTGTSLRWSHRGFVCLSWLSGLATLGVVGLFAGFLLFKGVAVLDLEMFFGPASPWEAIWGRQEAVEGLWPAVAGTILLVALSSLVAVPLGIGSGIYLARYAGATFKGVMGAAVELLAGVPSIVMGLFGFALILFLRRTWFPAANTGLWLSAGCLALLVLPYLIVATLSSLEGLPPSLALTGISLGFSGWQTLIYVLLPAASRGILSGVVLAVGRAAEDTAVILLTGVAANAGVPRSLTDKYAALPFQIYYLAAEHRHAGELAQAYGAALVLLVLTGSLYAAAYRLHATLTRKWAPTEIIPG